jgi:hypothetical protein
VREAQARDFLFDDYFMDKVVNLATAMSWCAVSSPPYSSMSHVHHHCAHTLSISADTAVFVFTTIFSLYCNYEQFHPENINIVSGSARLANAGCYTTNLQLTGHSII